MSFSFFKQFKLKTPQELVRVTKDALLALDTKTVADVRLLDKALEEVDKNLVAMKHMLIGEGDVEPNPEHVSQLTVEVCKDDFLELLVQKMPTLGWEARKDTVHIWCTLLRQKVGSTNSGLEYIQAHPELLDFLVSCYENKDIASNCGNMLRECAKYPSLTKYMLESASFELFFKYVELPSFDIASDAFTTLKELLTRHDAVIYEFLHTHYRHFFELYDRLLSSSNYVTRRQSLKLLGQFLLERSNAPIMMQYISEVRNLKMMMELIRDPSKNIQSLAFHVFKVFVANPNKSAEIVNALLKNREKLLRFLDDFHLDKEDDQFVEEKEILLKELMTLRQPPHPVVRSMR